MSEIRFLTHREIDKEKWDRCVKGDPLSRIYGMAFYLDVVSPEWSALVKGDYEAVFPLPQKKKFGLPFIHQPLFTQQLGLFSSEFKANLDDFIKAIPKKFMQVYLQFPALPSNAATLKLSERLNFVLPLDDSDPRSKYNENTRRNVRKAEKASGVLKTDVHTELVWELKKQTSAVKLKDREWNTLLRLLLTLTENKLTENVAVYNGDELLAAVTFVHWNDRIYYLTSASSENGQANRCGFLIVDHVIRKYAGSGKVIDFEGSMDKNIAFFFKGFGASPEVYYSYKAGLN